MWHNYTFPKESPQYMLLFIYTAPHSVLYDIGLPGMKVSLPEHHSLISPRRFLSDCVTFATSWYGG